MLRSKPLDSDDSSLPWHLPTTKAVKYLADEPTETLTFPTDFPPLLIVAQHLLPPLRLVVASYTATSATLPAFNQHPCCFPALHAQC